eukprot:768603-Hanusia_phi.AAC.10
MSRGIRFEARSGMSSAPSLSDASSLSLPLHDFLAADMSRQASNITRSPSQHFTILSLGERACHSSCNRRSEYKYPTLTKPAGHTSDYPAHQHKSSSFLASISYQVQVAEVIGSMIQNTRGDGTDSSSKKSSSPHIPSDLMLL